MSGLAIDTTNGHRMRTIMQACADAAALAAAQDLPTEATVKDSAEKYATKNMPVADYGLVLDKTEDVILGNWDIKNRIWDPGSADVNAVQVILRRTTDSGNPVPTSLLHLVGLGAWDVQVTAIAVLHSTDDCWNNGIITKGAFIAQSNDEWIEGFCIHAEERLEFGSDNYADEDVRLSTNDKWSSDAFKIGGNGSGMLEGSRNQIIDEHITDQSMLPPLPDRIPEFFTKLSGIAAGGYGGESAFNISDYLGADFAMAFNITNVVRKSGDIDVSGVPPKGTMYISTGGKVTFKDLMEGAILTDVVAVAKVNVEVSASKATVRNAFFLGRDDTVGFGSQMNIGDAEYCDTKEGYVRAFAGKYLNIQGDAGINGFQGVSGDKVYIASSADSNTGIAIQANGPVEPQSNSSYGGCAAHFVGSNIKHSRLVL